MPYEGARVGAGWALGREWDFYVTEGGACPIKKELAKCKLTRAEAARLKTLMDRVSKRQTLPGDVKSLGGDLLEIRLDGDRRIFRLLYAEERGGLLLLGLTFFQKKTQATPVVPKATAKQRLKDWRKRQAKE
ncbi:type II toxin-antitoxin system RelE/ParE family toxin [Streptomyces sp. NPDC127051]|uniref:type II toxin-antitoxin system RelE/ParE family toxin n=1 Tax=Streptomyces sp. NPDC127051 TaxID=3347119 RepID=UPI00365755E4